MLVKGQKRLGPLFGLLVVLFFVLLIFYHEKVANLSVDAGTWTQNAFSGSSDRQQSQSWQEGISISTNSHSPPTDEFTIELPVDNPLDADVSKTHREIFSVSTPHKKYFEIEFIDREAINPNIIPHPNDNDTWIVVAQKQAGHVKNSIWCAELVCDAKFFGDKLRCIEPQLILPIAATTSDKCIGKLAQLAHNLGPHDARVFYGPQIPYAVYGSNSQFTCFGQFMIDFRVLVDWGLEIYKPGHYRQATELQRPLPYGSVEKNWFIFWDNNEEMYVHHDISPTRAFAKLADDGSTGPDLSSPSADNDNKCLAKHLPPVAEEQESIHQATNSLSITLCKRSDPSCEPNDQNTYIISIFQKKTYYFFHSVYEPYVMLFRQTAPFQLHAISTKPFWIHGRGKAGSGKKPAGLSDELAKTWDHTEMMYITSISWKQQGQKYHGYSDDILFVNFGIEDTRTGGIDITAGTLLLDLGLCANL